MFYSLFWIKDLCSEYSKRFLGIHFAYKSWHKRTFVWPFAGLHVYFFIKPQWVLSCVKSKKQCNIFTLLPNNNGLSFSFFFHLRMSIWETIYFFNSHFPIFPFLKLCPIFSASGLFAKYNNVLRVSSALP